MDTKERMTKEIAYEQFEKWLLEQPYWLQDATYRIYHGIAIDDSQIDKYTEMCISQARKEKTEYMYLTDKEASYAAGNKDSRALPVFDRNRHFPKDH